MTLNVLIRGENLTSSLLVVFTHRTNIQRPSQFLIPQKLENSCPSYGTASNSFFKKHCLAHSPLIFTVSPGNLFWFFWILYAIGLRIIYVGKSFVLTSVDACATLFFLKKWRVAGLEQGFCGIDGQKRMEGVVENHDTTEFPLHSPGQLS